MMAGIERDRIPIEKTEAGHLFRILLVDDHPVYRHGMQTLLSTLADARVVGQASSGEEALALAKELQPDVVLMDLGLPGINGIEATRRIKQRHPHISILVTTMFRDDQAVSGAIRAGAQGYILKDAGEEDLLRAVRAVGQGQAIFSPETMQTLHRHFNGAAPGNHKPALHPSRAVHPPAPVRSEHCSAPMPLGREAESESPMGRDSKGFGRLLRRFRRTTVPLVGRDGAMIVTDEALGFGDEWERSTPSILTFLVADIRGYTQFTDEWGDHAAAELTVQFARLAEDVVRSWEGRLVETRGDEILAVFCSARRALRAAVALQEELAAVRRANPSLPLQAGVGIDAGEAIPVQEGYRGGSLNLAARLCSIAGPGEVLCSEAVLHIARKTQGVTATDRGDVTVKGLSAPVRVIEVGSDGDGRDVRPMLNGVPTFVLPSVETHGTAL